MYGVNDPSLEVVEPAGGGKKIPESNEDRTIDDGSDAPKENAVGEGADSSAASIEVVGQTELATPNLSSPERSRASKSESPVTDSPYRLQVLEELTQGSSYQVGMNLGQESQPFATQQSQEERLFDTVGSTQESFHLDLPAEANEEETDSPVAGETETTAPSPTGSPPDEDTVIPSDASPPEDETVIPSFSETQATLIPSETQGTPTQLDETN